MLVSLLLAPLYWDNNSSLSLTVSIKCGVEQVSKEVWSLQRSAVKETDPAGTISQAGNISCRFPLVTVISTKIQLKHNVHLDKTDWHYDTL